MPYNKGLFFNREQPTSNNIQMDNSSGGLSNKSVECSLEQCSLCSEQISKLDVTFQCDKHSEHVICNDCIEDQTCPYCNAPVLERYVMFKIKDNVPILKNSAYF